MIANFSVVIGSAGRPTLEHTVQSFMRQELEIGDQIVVCMDTFEHPVDIDFVDRLYSMQNEFANHIIIVEYNSGYHWFGVEQINHILRTVPLTGSHIITMGDDDVFVDDAFKILRPLCSAQMSVPILYRFVAPWREILWDAPRMKVSKISGCCIAAPRAFVGEMPTKLYVEHDYDWMLNIIAQSTPMWLDEVLVIARPDKRGDDITHRGIVRNEHGWQFAEDVEGPVNA